MALSLTTAAGTPILTIADFKTYDRISISDDDDDIEAAIAAATAYAEKFTNRAFINQTWTLYLDAWPDEFALRKCPVSSVTSIKYYDVDGVLQTLGTAYYQTDFKSEPARVVLEPTYSWPSLETGRINAVQVAYVAGYGAASTDVPQGIIRAVKLMVAHWYENKEEVTIGAGKPFPLPFGAESLLIMHSLPEA